MPDQPLYIDAPIEFDETVLYQLGVSRIQQEYPNWLPKPYSMIDMMLRIGAMYAAVGAEVASTVPFDVFMTFGKLANKLPLAGVPASVDATFTVQDTLGPYLIPAMTTVGLTMAGSASDPIGFWTLQDLIIPPGSTTGNAPLTAILPGAVGNGLNTVVRVDQLGFVTDIAVTSATSNGADPEQSTDYTNRLSRELQNWTNTPILAPNFAIAVQNVPGVYRAAVWANYNPADGSTNNEKYTTICPIDINGLSLSSGLMTAVSAYIQDELRLLNFVCPVVAPTTHSVDVSYTAHCDSSVNQVTLASQILSALQTYLSPSTWGMPQTYGVPVPIWNNIPVIRHNKVIQVIENVEGVDWADPVTIGPSGAPVAADFTMTGAFPLPSCGLVTPTFVTT